MLVRNPQAPRGLFDGIVFDGSLAGAYRGSTYYHDASRAVRHSTLTNMVPADDWVWDDERQQWVLDFDGSNDYVLMPSAVQYRDPNVMSMCAWVNMTPTASSSRRTIFGCQNQASVVQLEIDRREVVNQNNNVAAIISGVFTATSTLGWLGGWHHICYTRSGTGAGTHALYRDGIALTLSREAGNNYVQGTVPTEIGRRASGSQQLLGPLGDPLIFDRTLAPPEATWLAQPQNKLWVPWRRKSWLVSAAATIEATLSESLAAGDSLVAALSALAATADGASLGDTQSATATGRPTVSDGTALGDTTEASATLRPTEADGATLGDSQEAATTGRPATSDEAALGDSLAASKTTSGTTSDAALLGDSQAAEATLRRSLVDGVIAGEQWAVRFTRAATIADGSLLGDSFEALVLTTIQAALSEGTQAGSAFAAAMLAYGAITEGIRTSDAYAAMVAAVASMADSATLGDVFSIVRVVTGAVADGALASDAFVASLAHYVRGPYYVAAGQVHSPGAVIGETFSAGIAAGQTHSAGALVGQVV